MATLPDIVLYPHCDLHVALHGAAPLNLRVMHRVATPGDPTRHTLTDVTTQCTFDFFAPYQAVGHRFDNLPAVDPATGLMNAPNVGIYLFLVHFNNDYLPARLQVHDTLRGWWFGNASITTALDARFAHAQPSIYASFSDDPSGTDLVGDITGHGYVTLTSQTPARFSVDARGRLQGVSEGGGTLRGQHLGVTHDLSVRVFDYARRRATLDSIQVPDLDRAAEMHNILSWRPGSSAVR